MVFASVTTPFAENWYFGAVLDGVRETLQRHGVTIEAAVVPWTSGSTKAAVETLDADLARPDCIGAVALGCSPSEHQAERLLRHGKPVVLTSVRSDVLPTVGVDDVAAAGTATRHLVDLGHRAIVHLTGFTARAKAADDFTMRIDRARGFSEEMAEARLEAHAQVKACDFESPAVVRQTAARLLTQPDRPSAIFAVTDEVAFEVLEAAAALRLRVPRDLSVIGIDDHPRSSALGLSTVRQSPHGVGAAAAERVLGRTAEEHQLAALELVARGTTARVSTFRSPIGRLLRLPGR